MRLSVLFVILCGCTDSGLDLLPLKDAASETSLDATSDTSADAECMQNGCACGLTACDGGCFDLANDPSHCGSCIQGCTHNAFCHQTACSCLPGYSTCGTGCADLTSDPNHCGNCNAAACTPGGKCDNSTCGTGPCSAGKTPCDVAGTIACVDLTTRVPYCGACGVVCAPNEVCAGAACVKYAPATPCTHCPCDKQCKATVGTTTCCPGIGGGSTPICVASTACP